MSLPQWCQTHSLFEFMKMMESYERNNNLMAKEKVKELKIEDGEKYPEPLLSTSSLEHQAQRINAGEHVVLEPQPNDVDRTVREFKDGKEITRNLGTKPADEQVRIDRQLKK